MNHAFFDHLTLRLRWFFVLPMPTKKSVAMWPRNSSLGFEQHSKKEARMSAVKKIGTHDGAFHCDEILAIVMLKKLPEYRNAEIVRTRDPKKLEGCDIVVDVGYVYDHTTKHYDHHQKGFTESMKTLFEKTKTDQLNLEARAIQALQKRTTTLSSAGLIYAHYGWAVLQTMCPEVEYNQTYRDLNVSV